MDGAERTILERLPRAARWWIGGVALDWRFAPGGWGWRRGDEIDVHGGGDPSWGDLRTFGDMAYDGGASPLLALRSSDGAVCGLDVEVDRIDRAVFVLSSSLDTFCATFALVDATVSAGSAINRERLLAEARALDPSAFDAGEWPGLLAVVDLRP